MSRDKEKCKNLVVELRKMALDVADDGTGTHIETLWWQAADLIESFLIDEDDTVTITKEEYQRLKLAASYANYD